VGKRGILFRVFDTEGKKAHRNDWKEPWPYGWQGLEDKFLYRGKKFGGLRAERKGYAASFQSKRGSRMQTEAAGTKQRTREPNLRRRILKLHLSPAA